MKFIFFIFIFFVMSNSFAEIREDCLKFMSYYVLNKISDVDLALKMKQVNEISQECVREEIKGNMSGKQAIFFDFLDKGCSEGKYIEDLCDDRDVLRRMHESKEDSSDNIRNFILSKYVLKNFELSEIQKLFESINEFDKPGVKKDSSFEASIKDLAFFISRKSFSYIWVKGNEISNASAGMHGSFFQDYLSKKNKNAELVIDKKRLKLVSDEFEFSIKNIKQLYLDESRPKIKMLSLKLKDKKPKEIETLLCAYLVYCPFKN